MRNILIRTLIGSACIMVLTFLCAGSMLLYKQNVPEQVEGNTVSIARTEYQEARARWDALQVREYELVIAVTQPASPEKTYRLNIDTESGEVDLLQVWQDGTEILPGHQDYPIVNGCCLQFNVADMFDSIENALELVEANREIDAEPGALLLFYDFIARFDPARGFPTEYAEYTRMTHETQEVGWRDNRFILKIKDVKVIR